MITAKVLECNFKLFYDAGLLDAITSDMKPEFDKVINKINGYKPKPKAKPMGDGELLRIGLWFIDKVGSPEQATKVLSAACASYKIMREQ